MRGAVEKLEGLRCDMVLFTLKLSVTTEKMMSRPCVRRR